MKDKPNFEQCVLYVNTVEKTIRSLNVNWVMSKHAVFTLGINNQSIMLTASKLDESSHNLVKTQILLSRKFCGFWLVPELGLWNFQFMASKFSKNMRTNFVVNKPLDFFARQHRPIHFLSFAEADKSHFSRSLMETSCEEPELDNQLK